MTVLHSAVLSGNEALVMLLLEQGQGAGADMPSQSGLLPVHLGAAHLLSGGRSARCPRRARARRARARL
jgi:hypothetical protein